MADVLSLVSSIIQVAAFGLKLSRTLHDYGEAVVGAEKRLEGLENDITFTSNIISQLGSHLKDSHVQALVSEDTIRLAQKGVAECHAIFQAMEDVIERIRKSGSLARWTIYFRDSKIELLRSNLDRMKGNLNLLLGVINHGTQITANRLDDQDLTARRVRIRELLAEKEYYTQRYLEERRRYNELLDRINSNSTLGSLLLITATDDSVAFLGQGPLTENDGDLIPEAESSRDAARRNWNGAPLQVEGMSASGGPTPELWSATPGQTTSPGEAAERTAISALSVSGARSRPRSSTSRAQPATPTAQPQSTAVDIAMRALADSPPPPSEALSTTTPLRRIRKRDRAARLAKDAVKGAGTVVSIAAYIALFPVVTSIRFIRLRRAKRRALKPPSKIEIWLSGEGNTPQPPPSAQLIDAQPAALSRTGTPQPSSDEDDEWAASAPMQGSSYDSWRIPGELPSLVELAADSASPEIAVTDRLLNKELRWVSVI